MYVITEYQYQQLRNCCTNASVDEIGRQPLKEESQITDTQKPKVSITDEIVLECQNYIDAAEGPYVLVSLVDLMDWIKQIKQLSPVS